MNRSPSQILDALRERGYTIKRGGHVDDFPGQGRRHSVCYRTPEGKNIVIIDQLTITGDTSYTPPRSYFGYLKMKNFRIEELTHEEIGNINKSKTMSIHGITFERLEELLNIYY